MTVLAHRVVSAGQPAAKAGTLYILHGILGSGGNWSSFASRLVERRPDWLVVLVDLRLHGDSRIADPPHDLAACARDLAELRDSLDFSTSRTAVLGHSFGGKVALEATRTLTPAPAQTWVIDSTPAPTSGEGSTRKMLQMLAESPETFGDREEAVAWVAAGGFDEATARWMAMNLRRNGGRWSWDLDVSGLQDLLGSFGSSDLWSIVEADVPDTDIRFVQASSGSILTDSDAERIKRNQTRHRAPRLTVLSGGHWLHIDNPEGMLELLAADLPRRPAS
jgi:pimeloyl-ACP methyl ester carboxylesterase